MTAYEKELQQQRELIDEIDYKIHDLLNERAKLALEIAKIKINKEGKFTDFYRPEREAEILQQIHEYNRGPLSDKAVANIFKVIMQECLAIQIQQYKIE